MHCESGERTWAMHKPEARAVLAHMTDADLAEAVKRARGFLGTRDEAVCLATVRKLVMNRGFKQAQAAEMIEALVVLARDGSTV